MAAPTRNFTDPTGLSSLAPSVLPPLAVPIGPRLTQAAALPQAAWKHPVLNAGLWMPRCPLPVPPVVVVPPPPLGKLVLATFPSIYKERGASSRPTSGQLQPRGFK